MKTITITRKETIRNIKKDTTLFNIIDSKTIRKKCTINQNKHKEMSKVKRSIIKIEKNAKQ